MVVCHHLTRHYLNGYSGTASTPISHGRARSNSSPAFVMHVPISDPDARTLYSVAAWTRGSNLTGTTPTRLACFYVVSGMLGALTSQALPAGTTGWTLLMARGVVPAGTARVQIRIESAPHPGAARFDDVRVRALKARADRGFRHHTARCVSGLARRNSAPDIEAAPCACSAARRRGGQILCGFDGECDDNGLPSVEVYSDEPRVSASQ
jgi:hypothetical protein